MSSSWRRDQTADALLSRQSRSCAVAGARGPIVDRPEVPKWLIEQQQELLRSAGSQAPAPQVHTPAKRQQEKKTARERNPTLHDDLIMVDLLDGAHLPTRPSQQQPKISSNSDSIISLPPIDDDASAKSWQALKSQNQDLRRTQRGGASIGGLPPNYLRAARNYNPLTNSPAQSRPRAKADVIIPIMEPLPPVTDASSLKPTRPFVRADAIDASQTALDRNRAANPVKPGMREQEIAPLIPPETVTWRSHSRQGSYNTRDGTIYEDDTTLSTSSYSNPSFRGRGRRREHFQPGIWGWRKPAEADAIMPRGAWIYLALIGVLTFFAAYCVNSVARFVSVHCINSTAIFTHGTLGSRAGLATLAGLRGLSLVVSFLLVLYIAPEYTMGSGIPEMKCVMSGVLMPRMLNWKTLVAKTSGLVFALSSAISIGRLGPFIHMSSIIAALVSKIPFFTSLHSSARFQLQALSAAMAAGVGATFGAPIGGTMLSIELMSTYYYIHWLPMALYCSIMGYYCVTLVQSENHAFFNSSVTVDLKLESLQRLFTYIILGVLCGLVGAALVQFTKRAFVFRKKHFTSSFPVRTAVMVFVFAVAHTLISTWVGGTMTLSQKDGVIQLINSTHNNRIWLIDGWKPFSYAHWNSSFTLLITLTFKFVLTGLSLVMPVPAGTFMPIFEVGALLGRAFGELCSGFSFVNWVDPRATAIIGAAAVPAGTLQTISVAVVMLELTREAIDILPLTIGVIVAYGVSTHLCSDLFSELIKIRRMPFILGLRERYPSENRQFDDDASSVVAGTFMWKKFPYVTPQTTKGEILKLLTRKGKKPWSFCALLSDPERRRLWGTISQQALWDVIYDENSVSSSDSIKDGYGTFDRDLNAASWESETVPFLREFNPSIGHPLVDMGPMQVLVSTPFWKVVTLFRMLSMTQMFVMQDGITVGSITRTQVIHYAHVIEERAKKRRARVREKELQEQRTRQEVIDHLRRYPPTSKRLASQPFAHDLSGLAVSQSKSKHGSFSGYNV